MLIIAQWAMVSFFVYKWCTVGKKTHTLIRFRGLCDILNVDIVKPLINVSIFVFRSSTSLPNSSAKEVSFNKQELCSINNTTVDANSFTVNGSYSDSMGSRSSESEPDLCIYSHPPSLQGSDPFSIEGCLKDELVSLFMCSQIRLRGYHHGVGY